MSRISQAVKWGVKSVGGLAANLALLTLWVDGVGIPPEFAVGINWVLISILGYVITDRWVFSSAASPSSLRGHGQQYLTMQSVMTAGKAVNYALYVGLMYVGVDYRIAWAIGAIVVFIGTFSGNKLVWESEIAQRG